MNLGTLTDRDLMRHWDVAARIGAATGNQGYIDRMKAIQAEMDKRDAARDRHLTQEEKSERRRNRLKWARQARQSRKRANSPKWGVRNRTGGP